MSVIPAPGIRVHGTSPRVSNYCELNRTNNIDDTNDEIIEAIDELTQEIRELKQEGSTKIVDNTNSKLEEIIKAVDLNYAIMNSKLDKLLERQGK